MSNLLSVIEKYKTIYNARLFRKRFIPIEKVARNPSLYGFKHEPIESNAQQKAFINDKTKVCALIAANRCGKTEAGVIKALSICLRQTRPGIFWIITESFDLQKSGVQVKIDDYLKPEDILDKEYAKKDTYKSITLRNGMRIEFKTFEQGERKLQSAKLVGALIDEECPEEIYEEVYLRTVDLSGQVILTFTPLRGRTWSFHRLFSSEDETVAVYKWGMADNIFIPRDEIATLRRNLSKKRAKTRLDGEYVSAEGQVWESFTRELNTRQLEYNSNLPCYVCVDWGVRFTDIGFYQNNKTSDEHYLIDHLRFEGAGYQKVMQAIMRKPYNVEPENYFCDPAGSARNQGTKSGRSLLAEIEDEFDVKFRYKKKLGIEESVEIVDSYILNAVGVPRLFIDERLLKPIECIENYVRDAKTNQPIKDGNVDHFCDQLRYYLANMSQLRKQDKWGQR